MENLRKITELDTIESLDNAEGLSIIANDNGQAKQIPASLLGGLTGGGGGSVCYYVAYGDYNIYTDRERTTPVALDEFKDAMINNHVVFIDPESIYGEDEITIPTKYQAYNNATINITSSSNRTYRINK